MTTLNFQLAHAVARTLEPGDEIVVTALDHDANVSPWLLVAEDHDLVVRTRAAPSGRRDARRRRARGADRRAHPRGRLHAGLQRGRLDPRRRRGSPPPRTASARSPGPTASTSRRTGGCGRASWASTSCSARRTSSSARTSASRRIRPDLAESLPADRVRPADEDPPGHRFEAGTQSHEAIAGATAAIEYLRDLGDGDLDAAFALDRGARDAARGALPRAGCRTASTLYGIRDPRGPHADLLLQRRRPGAARGGRAARRAGPLRLGRRLLRPRADARARPRRQRRRRARRLPPLHDRGRGRPAARGARTLAS